MIYLNDLQFHHFVHIYERYPRNVHKEPLNEIFEFYKANCPFYWTYNFTLNMHSPLQLDTTE